MDHTVVVVAGAAAAAVVVVNKQLLITMPFSNKISKSVYCPQVSLRLVTAWHLQKSQHRLDDESVTHWLKHSPGRSTCFQRHARGYNKKLVLSQANCAMQNLLVSADINWQISLKVMFS